MEQFPGQTQGMGNITDNTNLMITFGVEPFLHDSICLTTPEHRLIEPLAQCRQQFLNPSSMLGKSLVGPFPVLFKAMLAMTSSCASFGSVVSVMARSSNWL